MRIHTTLISFAVAAYALATDGTAQGVRKPVPLPGTDPGGVMVAYIGPGIDYTRSGLAERLARDGEGEIIGFDLVDRDRRPFCRVGCEPQTDAVLALLNAAPNSRLAIFKVDGTGLAAPALQMAVTAKAAVVVLDLPDDPQAAALLRAASERFRDTMIVYAPRIAPAVPGAPAPAPVASAPPPAPVAAPVASAPVASPAPAPTAPVPETETATALPQPPVAQPPVVPPAAQPAPQTAVGDVASPAAQSAPPLAASPAPQPSAPVASAPAPPNPASANPAPANSPPATADAAPSPPPVATAPPPANGRADTVLAVRDGNVKPAETALLAAARLAADAIRIVTVSPSTRGAALKARVEEGQ